jgi:hypothetical protein
MNAASGSRCESRTSTQRRFDGSYEGSGYQRLCSSRDLLTVKMLINVHDEPLLEDPATTASIVMGEKWPEHPTSSSSCP